MAIGPGSIAIVEVNADDQDAGTNVTKTVSFVLLDVALRGQTIFFTDNGWLAAGGFRTGEGVISFAVPADAALGTVYTVGVSGTASPTFNPSTSGDAVIAYVGTAASPTILFAVQFGSNSASWAADATTANTSAVPTGLVNGDTALAFALDNAAYTGPLTGTAQQILANIADENNWTQNDTARVSPPANFTVSAGSVPTVAINDITLAEGNTGTTNFTFTVTRSDNSTAFSVDYATANGTATAGSDYTAATGTLTFAAGGALTQTITVSVAGDTVQEGNETFTVTLSNISNPASATFADASGLGTITNDDITLTAIYTIQGASHTSTFAGQSVTTTGIVTAVDTNGFYIQDATGDNNSATSDGIFVFTSTAPPAGAVVGNLVQVTGTVAEFAGTPANSLTLTEITSPTVSVISTGNALPAAILIGPDGIQPPHANLEDDGFTSFDPATDGLDFWESLEGMRVVVQSPIAVSTTNSFGEIYTVASNGSGNVGTADHFNPTGALVISGAINGQVGTNNSVGGDFNPEKIQIDADSGLGSPVVNVAPGAVLNNVTGIVNYSFGAYEVVAVGPITVASQSTNTIETTSLVTTSTQLTIGSYNAQNLDPGDGAARFAALATDIAVGLQLPGIVVLTEIQDNNGPTNDGTIAANVTLQMVVDAIFAQTGVQYSYIDNPFITNGVNGGEPGGNIRVTFIYRTDTVSFVSGSLHTVTNPTDQATNTANPFNGSRLPLAGDFLYNGQTVTVIGNHFTSKGGSSPLQGNLQPSTNAGEAQRAGQAALVNSYVDSLLAVNPNAKIVVAGDLNEFQTEEPIRILTGEIGWNGSALTGPTSAQVLNNLTLTLPENERFTYIFEGNAQAIDHILVSNALAAGAEYDIVHRNTQFGEVNSDHEPIIARITVLPLVSGTNGVDSLSGTTGRDEINGLDGNDTLYGLGGNDILNGGTGNDRLDGGTGDDQLTGGTGDDTYVVDSAGDIIVENPGEGIDTVETTLAVYTLAPDLERLTFTGTGAFSGYGNAANNVIIGGADGDVITGDAGNDNLYGGGGSDLIDGGDGNDVINGGTGADVLIGGLGNDTFVVNELGDTISGGDGIDTLEVTLVAAYVAPDDVENLGFSGSTDFAGTGNALANGLSGGTGNDTFYGLDGDDMIYGRAGNDTLYGGNDNDQLFGDVGNDMLFGGAGRDYLSGGDGNDWLDGGTGADTFSGGAGDDTYVVDDAGDTVSEFNGSGTDLVMTTLASYTLVAGVENLTFTDAAAHRGTGNDLDNVITGHNGNDTLTGGNGNDTLIGMGGNDTFFGGAGDDTTIGGTGDDIYYLDSANDIVIELANEGRDTVQTTASTYILADNVENLNYTGTGSFSGSGNDLANIIYTGAGNDTVFGGGGQDNIYTRGGNDTLDGGAGRDFLTGGAGQDVLTGGADNDYFIFTALSDTGTTKATADRITDFSRAQLDKIDLSQIDANSVGGTANDAFSFIGTAAFHNVAGEARYELDVDGNTYVYLDANGDGVADAVIRIDGNVPLVATDFLL